MCWQCFCSLAFYSHHIFHWKPPFYYFCSAVNGTWWWWRLWALFLAPHQPCPWLSVGSLNSERLEASLGVCAKLLERQFSEPQSRGIKHWKTRIVHSYFSKGLHFESCLLSAQPGLGSRRWRLVRDEILRERGISGAVQPTAVLCHLLVQKPEVHGAFCLQNHLRFLVAKSPLNHIIHSDVNGKWRQRDFGYRRSWEK